ncbi:MAG: SPOR domain-containing protein [Clostridia bacterium]|nr:SPOR domain-containing protein [Clostridia bacterium]
MVLKQCILTRNDCYTKGTKMTGGKPTGIVVHSTGANNPNLKRYVQPLPTDKDYNTIMADLGDNIYDNDWNKSYKAGEINRQVCVHAFIGKNAAGNIETYQTLPFNICCWGVGGGAKGSYNNNPRARVQFEICEDGLTDKTYFDAVFKEAIEFCAYLCKVYNLPVSSISSHAESYKAGYGSNHGDCDHWLKKFGKDMDWFRAEVKALLTAEQTNTATTKKLYRVQVGAYAVKKNADGMANRLKNAGFNTYMVKSGTLYKVQVGAYSVKANATNMLNTLKKAGFSGYVTTSTGTAVAISSLKSVDEIAREVINGKWGNGSARKKKLTAAGYDYATIQKRVNELC